MKSPLLGDVSAMVMQMPVTRQTSPIDASVLRKASLKDFIVIAACPFITTSLSAKVINSMLSVVNLVNAMGIPAAATTTSPWTRFPLSTTEGVEESVTIVSTTQQEGTVSCVRTTFSDQWEQTLQPSMFANPVIVRKEAPETGASFVIRLEASVIVRDVFLADGAISARMDSTISKSWSLMAVGLATAIPLGQWMEILPVTQIQASASAKQTLLGFDVIIAMLDLNSSKVLMMMDVSPVGVTSTAR